jgi:hypothetical protein
VSSPDKRSNATATGAAVKTEEYVPMRIPAISASAKSVRVSPPRKYRATRMNRAPRPVLIVRGTVWRHASFATSARGSLGRSARCSRMRSNTTTESLID